MKFISASLALLALSRATQANSFSFETSAKSTAQAQIWKNVEQGPPDAILGIAQAFRASTDDRKVNVCVGAYRDNTGAPWVLPSVRAAEKELLAANDNKEYLPIDGDSAFVSKALAFAYGADADLDLIAGVQTLSGTGACRVGGQFLAKFCDAPIYIPVPTWGNHWKIFAECGLDCQPYTYYDRSTNGLSLNNMLTDIEGAPDGSIMYVVVYSNRATSYCIIASILLALFFH